MLSRNQMDSFTYMEQKIEKFMRKYALCPRYMAWRIMWASFRALFLKNIPHIPQAHGLLLDIQLASFKFLQEIDRVCKESNLVYWIDFGTLLGAVRHGGFIPWDDDIDLSMPRKDYEQFAHIFNKKTKNSQLYAEYCFDSRRSSVILKVKHKKIPKVFIDIFSIDFCDIKMNDKEKLFFTDKIKKLAKRKSYPQGDAYSPQKLHKECLHQRKQIPGLKDTAPAKMVFYGIEYFHRGHKYNAFDYETIFPLKTISFCGRFFPCVAKTDIYLSQCFGNYKKLPKKLHFHSLEASFTSNEKKALRVFLEKK